MATPTLGDLPLQAARQGQHTDGNRHDESTLRSGHVDSNSP